MEYFGYTSVPRLERRAHSVQRRFLAMYREANAGHVGSALSCAELLVLLRFAALRPGDEMILSKGHAAAALYATLAESGDISDEEILSFYRDGTALPAHPPPSRRPGIPFATGSLGHGLSLGVGLALAMQLRGAASQVFCVTSDGELDAGSTWEAALFASHHRLTNLRWFIDRNGLQGFGRTEGVLALEPLVDKLRAFGWEPIEADGHSFVSLLAALAVESTRPRVVIARTTKGRGWVRADTVASHYLPLTPDEFDACQRGFGVPGESPDA